jgi:hypothetical protein
MSKKRSCMIVLILLALSLVGGVAVGFVLGWVVWPVTYVDTDVVDLRVGYQDDYIVMTGDAYALDRNLTAAKERLAHLEDPAVNQRVAGLVRSKMAASEPAGRLRSLVLLAEGLSVASRDMLDYTATETPTPTPVPTATETPTTTPVSTRSPTATSTETATATARPPATATLKPSPTWPRLAAPAGTATAWYMVTPLLNLTMQAPR